MHKEHEDQIDPAQPALVVVYGATKRKRRPLLSELVVVGRSPGCDIGLVSPDVAPVHCIILRVADGWRIRDCSGRATRVNGRAIHDEPLKNGDNIQVGTFSFEAHLPSGGAPPSAVKPVLPPVPAGKLASQVPSPAQERLKRSRRRLVEMALRLRAQVREQAKAEADLRQRQADLEQVERRLRVAHPEGQVRGSHSEHEGQALAEMRAVLDSERGRLASRADELNQFAAHLRRHERRLREREAEQACQAELDRAGFESDLTRYRVEVEHDHRDLMEMRQAVQQRQAELEATVVQLEEMVQREREEIQRQREKIVNDQEGLDQQRQELLQQRLALERMQGESPHSKNQNASTRDTWFDSGPARLESARRLLRELAERRKAGEQGSAQGDKGPSLRLLSDTPDDKVTG